MAGIAGEVAGSSGAGVVLGYLAWKKLGWPQWVIFVTSAAGMAVAFYRVVQLAGRLDDDGKG